MSALLFKKIYSYVQEVYILRICVNPYHAE